MSALLVFSASGCGQQQAPVTSGSTIELIEPANVTENTEPAAYRNLYNYKVYSANVLPVVYEYAFEEGSQIESWEVCWGDSVKKGTTLVSSNTEQIDKQIEDKEEYIANMEESLAEAKTDLEENLEKPREQERTYKWAMDNLLAREPAKEIPAPVSGAEGEAATETVAATATEMIPNPEYATWEQEYKLWEGRYRIQAHNIDMQEEAMRQREALYQLDHAYQLELLAELKASRKNNLLSSKMTGEVVALAIDGYGNQWAEAQKPLVAIGDTESKILKTEFINKTNITKAADIYALIDGVRYEVEYQPMDSDEYAKKTAAGEKVYSTFVLKGDCSQVEIGDFAVIAIFSEKKENVLSVPKAALRKDEKGHFVYVVRDGETVAVTVQIGMSDGVYTEIVSGIAEGDRIMVETAMEYGEKTVEAKYGSFGSSFEGRGMLYYSEADTVRNPVEYGTTYFGEYQVAQYAHVEKGDVIATVRVMTDDITLQRYRVKLQRAQERLADLLEDGEDQNEEYIEAKREEIAELTETLAEMEADGKTTKIRATRSGIVVGLAEYEQETIVNYEGYIADIADEESCYVVVENTNQLLNYGDDVTISYTNNAGEAKESTGMVATVSNVGLSVDLQSDMSFILLPQESIADMSIINSNGDEWWNRYRYTVKADIRQMENVIVVPKKAVTEINGRTYVNVVDKDGNVKSCCVVTGGYDSANYWIIEGLSEGMVVCLK